MAHEFGPVGGTEQKWHGIEFPVSYCGSCHTHYAGIHVANGRECRERALEVAEDLAKGWLF